MNVEVGTEAVQFPEREYIKGIFAAVQQFGKKKVKPATLQKLTFLTVKPNSLLIRERFADL